MSEIYQTRMSWPVRVISGIVIVLALSLFGKTFSDYLHKGLSYSVYIYGTTCLLLVLGALWSWYYSAKELVLTDKELIVVRRGKSIALPLSAMTEVYNGSVYRSIRVFGSGGLFGYLGLFRNPDIGYYRAMAGDLSESFFVVTAKRKYLLSCKNHLELIEKLQQHAKV